MSLKEFCLDAIHRLSQVKDDARIKLCMRIRYDELRIEFPSKTFSTEEAGQDFFQKTIDYIDNPKQLDIDLKDKNILEYRRNYLSWVKSHI
jgi:hypothetical protein